MRLPVRPFAALLVALVMAVMAGISLSGTANAEGGNPAKAWVIHAAPFASGTASVTVDVISGTTTLASIPDFIFAETTGAYVDLPSGTDLDLEVTPTGGSSPAITATVNLNADTFYSVAAIGGANGWPLELFPLADNVTAPAAGNFKIRVVHLAPFAPTSTGTEVSIRTQDGTVVGGLSRIQPCHYRNGESKRGYLLQRCCHRGRERLATRTVPPCRQRDRTCGGELQNSRGPPCALCSHLNGYRSFDSHPGWYGGRRVVQRAI